MKLTQEEVGKIADLARLEFSGQELQAFQAQLSSILNYIEKLSALNVEGIEPTAHAVEISTPFREDILQPNTTLEDSLKNAPEREATLFKVPRVLNP